MKSISTANSLPTIKQAKKHKINKKKLLELSDKVREILKKEGRLNSDEDIFFSRNAFSS